MSNSKGLPSLRVKLLESREEPFPRMELETAVCLTLQDDFSKMMKYMFSNTKIGVHCNVKSNCKKNHTYSVSQYLYISYFLMLRSKIFLNEKGWDQKYPFTWCQLAILSHDKPCVLDSDSSYSWMIIHWWVRASVCHETSMTERWWECKHAWSCPALSPFRTDQSVLFRH